MDISKMNAIELSRVAVELKKGFAQMRFDKATGKLMDTSAPKKQRRKLAQVLTKISEVARQKGE